MIIPYTMYRHQDAENYSEISLNWTVSDFKTSLVEMGIQFIKVRITWIDIGTLKKFDLVRFLGYSGLK